ncbi:MAG: PqqD family protein [Candidatus Rokuibacteriota bacterium]
MEALSLRSRVAASGDVVFRDLDAEMVLLDMRSGVYFSLDAVATRIWQLLQRHSMLEPVLDELIDEFDVPAERCADDLLGFVTLMRDKGLVEVRVGAGA